MCTQQPEVFGAGAYVDIPPRLLPCNIRLLLPCVDFSAYGTTVPSHAVMPSVSEDSVCRAGADALHVGTPELHYTEGAGAINPACGHQDSVVG